LQALKEPAEKMMAHFLIDGLCKFAGITFTGILPGVCFQSKILPGALSERLASVCKKRLAPHWIPVIKPSKMTGTA
jgi:hypothetical protein